MSNNSSLIDHNNGLDYILLFRLIVWGYVGMVLSLFGIVGNIITILVLISPSMRTTSTNIYLTAISCSNILFLLIFIPSYSIRYLIGYRLYITNQPPFAFELLLTRLPTTPIYNTITLSIIYLTIAVSMDRLILVKVPLKAKKILTPRTTMIAIALIYSFSILYCIPYWLEQEYKPELKQCRLTHIGRKIYKYTRIYIYIPVVYLIPFTTLTCINISIIINLVANKRRKKSLAAKTNKKKQADYHITLMLVAVIIVFVLCQMPLLVLNAWHAIDSHGSSESILFHSLNTIGILLLVCNTSTNFLLYCFFGEKFRKTLVRFIFNLFLNPSKQTNLHSRISKLADSETRGSRPTRTSNNLTSESAISKRKSTELSQGVPSETSKHSAVLIPTTIPEESSPLFTDAECNSTDEKASPSKSDQKFNLYTYTNGKQLLVLKI
ncbi:unnamed protein product [Adineta ricciae]|uniref:G-protein coupled receptors family 1 profile domain-containing protein n=2 Tax=Adineta ricciae TaxID=249248 RepID=A0A816H386_ADIRI|nr:unnamed protein product [Adineta ricciae]CAF1681490.1 unnamed protein product [Adineta ricciae]